MDTESEISIGYEAELAEIAALDRLYYQTVAASRADRADYYRRQDQLAQIRTRLYAELSAARKKAKTPKVTGGILRISTKVFRRRADVLSWRAPKWLTIFFP